MNASGTSFAKASTVGFVFKIITLFYLGFSSQVEGLDFAPGCKLLILSNMEHINHSTRGTFSPLDVALLSDEETYGKSRLASEPRNLHKIRYEEFDRIQEHLESLVRVQFLVDRDDYDEILESTLRFIPEGEELSEDVLMRTSVVLEAMKELEEKFAQAEVPMKGESLGRAQTLSRSILERLPALAHDERVPPFIREYLSRMSPSAADYGRATLKAVQSVILRVEAEFLHNVR